MTCTNNKPKTDRPDTSFHVRITERSDTLIKVQIIEGSYNGGSDNRGSTVIKSFRSNYRRYIPIGYNVLLFLLHHTYIHMYNLSSIKILS